MPNQWGESEEYLPRITVDSEAVKELESCDVDEIVMILGLTTNDIIRAFPGHVYDYIGIRQTEEGYNDDPYGHRFGVYQADEGTQE